MRQVKQNTAENAYFPMFDWLRFALAMTVALSHGGVSMVTHAPNFAVQVFFALSGWLIGGILIDSDSGSLSRFYFNRAMRIWAPYYVSVTLVFAVSLLKEPLDANWLEYLFYDLTYTHNWFITPRILEIKNDLPLRGTTNHFWSLSVEEQFYLFAPLIILFLRWGRSPIMWAGVAALAIGFQTLFGAIALGVAAVALQRRIGDWHITPRATLIVLSALFMLVMLYNRAPQTYYYLAPLAAVLIVLLFARPGRRQKLGFFFGAISYPLYLNHWIGIFISHEIIQLFPFVGLYNSIAIGAVSNIAIASVLYLFIDKQIRKRRKHWFTESRGAKAAAAAYGLIVLGVTGGLALGFVR